MYLSIPEVFYVPVTYLERKLLNIGDLKKIQNIKIHLREENITIGAILPTLKQPRWVRDHDAMIEEAKEKGVNLKIEFSEYDEDKHVELLEKLINEKVDVIITGVVGRKKQLELLEKAKAQGIKIISYDNVIYNGDIDLIIAFNELAVGELQGKYLTKAAPKGNYIIMEGNPGGAVFKKGAMEYINPLAFKKDISIVSDKVVDGWGSEAGYNIVKEALTKNNNNIQGILAPLDTIAGGAIRALEEQGLAGKVIVTGQNADFQGIKRIIEGTQYMTVFKDSTELAKIAINSAIKLKRAEAIDTNALTNNGKGNVPTILLEPLAVDRTNIFDVLKDKGYYLKELSSESIT